MTEAQDTPTPGPYAHAAPTYWAAGWRGILPLPERAKTPVPNGYTGNQGAWPSYPDVQAWTEDRGTGNIALRLPPDVLGIDVDHYDAKPGGAILQALEQQLGPLPATWRTTSRDDGVSGIRLYRIPAGLRWPGILGPGIETIRHAHRYAVAWPSVHPSGGTYRWITPEGAIALGTVPSIDDLPPLPDAWIQQFTGGELATDQERAALNDGQVHEWVAARGAGTPCRHTQTATAHGLTDLGAGGARHDAALALTNRLVWLAGEGHTGADAALQQARDAFLRATAGDREQGAAEAEWDRMVDGAVRIAAAAHPTPQPDPCTSPFPGLIAPALAPRKDTPSSPSSAPSAATAGTTSSSTTSSSAPNATAAATEPTSTPPPEPERPRTSWWPRSLEPAITGEDPEPPPAYLVRDDGQPLFYPGKVNGLIGPSESGKTWAALLAVRQAVELGENTTFLDFEDAPSGLVKRLRSLGLTDDQLRAHVAYVGPDEALDLIGQADLLEHLQQHAPGLIVLDGVNAAMTLLGLDLNSNTDATSFAQRVLRPLAKTGAALVYVDHTPKSKDNETAGGIGAQAKRAMTTGCCLKVEVIKEFGIGQEGKLRLRVDKDRAGHVRGASLPGKAGHWAADVVITSSADGTDVAMELRAPAAHTDTAGQAETFRPTALMQRVSSFLATVPEGASQRVIREGVKGKAEYVVQALDLLVAEGYAAREEVTGRGGARLVHRHLRAYTDVSDLLNGSGSPSGSQVVPGTASSGSPGSGSPVPLPSGGQEPLTGPTGRPGTGPKNGSGSRGLNVRTAIVAGQRVQIDMTTGEIIEDA